MSPSRERFHRELEKELVKLQSAAMALQHSYHKCAERQIPTEASYDDYEPFETLASRFERLCDILTQKVFGLIDALEGEERGTFIDKLNRAEKRGIVDSAQALRDVRDLRNEIAHEYSARDISELFQQALALAPSLLNAVKHTIEYSQKLTAR